MAPYIPEEVDVFTGPHSRMKGLVNDYVEMLQTTNFSDVADLKILLDSLRETFKEFKLHEQIENTLIMKRLKNKLKKLSISNTLVCNCHKGTHLTDMLTLVQEGFGKKNDQDRLNYSLQLKKALELFTDDFLPHMKQEEEIFQPLLLEYFTYEELCELKRKVIDFHSGKPLEGFEKGLREEAEKEESTEDSLGSDLDEEDEGCPPQTSILDLPMEVMTQIFSYLDPRELGQCRQVCERWSQGALDPRLWTEIHPAKWANGDWGVRMNDVDYELEEEEEVEEMSREEEDLEPYPSVRDDDADVDESEIVDSEGDPPQSNYSRKVQRQRQVLLGILMHVLPSVGHSVKVLNLGHCHALTNVMLQRLLKLVPNVEYLNLAGTRISDCGLKRIGKNGCGVNLRHLNLSGCGNMTDMALERIGLAMLGANAAGEQLVQGVDGPCWCEKQQLGAMPPCAQNDHGDLDLDLDLDRDPDLDLHRDMTQEGCLVCVPEPDDNFNVNSQERFTGVMLNAAGDTEAGQPAAGSPVDSPVMSADVPSGDNRRWTGSCHERCGSMDGGPPAHVQLDPIEDCARPVCGASSQLPPPSGKMTQPTVAPPFFGAVSCVPDEKPGGDLQPDQLFEEDPFAAQDRKPQKLLSYLNLSGCHQLTDYGMSVLALAGPLPQLTHLDLSGCPGVTGAGIAPLVAVCPALQHDTLFYCDNILDGPYADTASGCQNVYCSNRVCCRKGY